MTVDIIRIVFDLAIAVMRIACALVLTILALSGCAGHTPLVRMSMDDYLTRADSCTSICRWDQAEHYLNEAIRSYPTHIKPWLHLGKVIEERQESRRALDFWNRIIAVRPEEKEAIIGRWRVLHGIYQSSRTDSVHRLLVNEIEKWDNIRPRTQLSLELAYAGWTILGEETSAEAAGAILAFRHPESEESRQYETRSFHKIIDPVLYDRTHLISVLTDFLSNHLTSSWRFEAYRLLTRAYEERRDFQSLSHILEDLRREMPNDPRALELSARVYLDNNLGDYRALQYARLAIDAMVHFSPPPVYSAEQWRRERCRLIISGSTRYGQALLRRGDVETARRVIEDLLDNAEIQNTCDASLAGAYVILAETFLSKEKYDLAIDALINALIIGDPSGTWDTRAENRITSALRAMNIESNPVYYARALKRYDGPRFRDISSRIRVSGMNCMNVAWVDFDNDGWDDILLNGTTLLKNYGGTRFEDITAAVHFPKGQFEAGVWGDLENDGTRNVLLIPVSGSYSAEMYQFDDGRFVPTAIMPISKSRIYGATYLDVDQDGDLDLFIAREPDAYTNSDSVSGDLLIINQGKSVFSAATTDFGTVTERQKERGVCSADYDGDGDMDILVTAQRGRHIQLWLNDQNRRFGDNACTRELFPRGNSGTSDQSVHCAWGDYDNDGDLDLFCTRFSTAWDHDSQDQSVLFELVQSDPILFLSHTSHSGIKCTGSRSEPTWCDVDLDGDLDLLLVADNDGRGIFLYMNENRLFTDATYLSGLALSNAHGCATSDFDHDGDQDLLIATKNGVRLYRNEAVGNWLAVTAVGNGITTNADCIGCRIEIISNGYTQIREVTHLKSTLNQSSLTQIFGLKSDDIDVSTIRVHFTDGDMVEIPGVAPNQLVMVHQ